MSTYLWGATVLREFCSSTRLPFFQKRRGSHWSHERTPQYNPPETKVNASIYLYNKLEYIS